MEATPMPTAGSASAAAAAALPLMGSSAIEAGLRAGNINLGGAGAVETLELSETSRAAQQRHASMLLDLEIARRARLMVVPIDIADVKRQLRELGHPVTMFGEGPMERRDRLRRVLAEAEVAAAAAAGTLLVADSASSAAGTAAAASTVTTSTARAIGVDAEGRGYVVGPDGKPAELFYTPAEPLLLEARKHIAAYSFAAASARLTAQAAVAADEVACREEDAAASRLHRDLGRLVPLLTQVADERPGSALGLSTDGRMVATGSWGALVKVWDSSTLELRCIMRGHRNRVIGIAWQPGGGGGVDADGDVDTSPPARLFVSASLDGTAKLWRVPDAALPDAAATRGTGGSGACAGMEGLDDTAPSGASPSLSDCREMGVREVSTFAGHTLRLGSVAFHPSGLYFGTASYDSTWRLWDIERPDASLLLQEGHAREVYAVAFHPDGSLAASGDLGGGMRVWDLRSGKSVIAVQAHAKQLLGLDFAADGHRLASSSDDNTVAIWELRQQRRAYTLPAHSGLIPKVKFSPATAEALVTCSYDGTVRVWSGRDYALLTTLRGHDGRVAAVDVSPDERRIYTISFDRTVKAWGVDGGAMSALSRS